MDQEEAAAALRHWREVVDSRDRLVLAAVDSGLDDTQIHRLTRLSRVTIGKIRKNRTADR